MIDKDDITGLVLAGGRGSRMGGMDKGLQPYRGIPLARHMLLRLAPQVGRVLVNANRNLDAYEAMGVPVWPDALPGYTGPLAGFLAGLEHCATPYMITVPCDAPGFPDDLAARLALGLEAENAEVAMAVTQGGTGVQFQPVFCLMKAELLGSLLAFTASGRRKTDAWILSRRCAQVMFDNPSAFAGANTLAELQRL